MGRTSDARIRLMNAAHELIWEHSYGTVTIDAICLRAGVKKGSFYYFFDSKSDLASAALDAWWTQRKIDLARIFHPEVPPLERIRNYIDLMVQRQLSAYRASGHILGCPIFTLGTEIATQDEGLRSRIHAFLTGIAAAIESAVRDAQALGQLSPGCPAQKARAIMCFYEGSLIRARIEKNSEILHRLVPELMDLLGVEMKCSPEAPAALVA